MSVNDQLDKLQRSLLDFFFPRRCPFCGRVVGKALLCETCEKELPYSREVRTGTFGRCAAPLYYEGAVREAILSFKFKGRTEALDCFGSLMARTAAETFSGEFDAVTWVPVSAKRLRKRGFDQARYLCASLCVDWHTTPLREMTAMSLVPPPMSTTMWPSGLAMSMPAPMAAATGSSMRYTRRAPA